MYLKLKRIIIDYIKTQRKNTMNIDKLIIATIYLIYVFNIVDKPKENLINKTSKATLY